jgi:hypothetical protein
VDERLAVLEVRDGEGAPLALLVFLPLPGDPAPIRAAVEAILPGDVPVLLLPGPGADQEPALPPDEFSAALAAKVEEARASAHRVDPPQDSRWSFPRERELTSLLHGPVRATLHRVAVGRIAVLAVPGRLTAEAGLALRRASPSPLLLVCRADRDLGLFPSERQWRTGRYGAGLAPFGPEAADALLWLDEERDEVPVAGSLGTRGGFRLLTLRGSPREMGHAHGRLLREEIRSIIRSLHEMVSFAVVSLRTEGTARERMRELLNHTVGLARPLQRFLPDRLLEEMAGIAEGAGISYDEVLLLNVLPLLLENPWIESLRWPPRGAAAVSETPGGAARLHGRLRWRPAETLRKHLVAILRRPDRGFPSLAVELPGSVGVLSALNSEGVAVHGHSLATLDRSDLRGIPVNLLLREAIERSATLAQAVSRVRHASRAAAWRVTLAAGGGQGARVVDLERSRTKVAPVTTDGPSPASEREDLVTTLADTGARTFRISIRGRETVDLDLGQELRGDGGAPPIPPAEVEPLSPVSHRKGYSVQRVWMSSPRPSGRPQNDRFPVEHYVPQGGAAAAVIVLPIWRGGVLLGERIVAAHLATRGYEAAILPLPWQFQRAEPGVGSGSWTVSGDLDRTKAAMEQALADVRALTDWLRARAEVRDGNVGVLGISLGAHVAAGAYQLDERLRAAVIVMAGGDPASMVWAASKETRGIKRELVARGVTLENLREMLRPLDPAAALGPQPYPGFPRHGGVLMVNGTRDTVIPPANARILHRALGEPEIVWLPVDHYSMATKVPELLELTDRHLDRVFR